MTRPCDFDLFIAEGNNTYSVQARTIRTGELPAQQLILPFDPVRLPDTRRDVAEWIKQARITRLSGPVELHEARTFGKTLFDILFPPGELLAAFRSSRSSLTHGERLRLRLRLPPALVTLPWELLYDQHTNQFLALAADLTLVRYPEMPTARYQRPGPLPIDDALRVVAVLASPESDFYPELRIDRELGRLELALKRLRDQGQVQLDIIRGPGTLDQLRERLRQPAHILHILSHGDLNRETGEGELLFEDTDGAAEAINAELLRMELERQFGQVQLITLNACLGALPVGNDPFSSVGLALIRSGVPAVVAMQFEIAEDVAAELTRVLYSELASGMPVDQAVSEARRRIYGRYRTRLDWAIPVLFSRTETGVLFEFATPRPDPNKSGKQDDISVPYDQEQRLSNTASVQQRLQEQYHRIGDLRAAGQWQAVLNALDELECEYPGSPDPDGHRRWAEGQHHQHAPEVARAVGRQDDMPVIEVLPVPPSEALPGKAGVSSVPDGLVPAPVAPPEDPPPESEKTLSSDVSSAHGRITRLLRVPPIVSRLALLVSIGGLVSVLLFGVGGMAFSFLEMNNFLSSTPVNNENEAFATQQITPDNTPLGSGTVADKIVLMADPDNKGTFELYTANVDGSALQQLTNNQHNEIYPAWSPDGTQIAYASDATGNYEIFVSNSDGTNERQITNNGATDFTPIWSPDGTRIAFASNRDGDFEIYLMDADGKNISQLTDNGFDDRTPDWSPDGQWIAFATNRHDNNFELYRRSLESGHEERLTEHGSDDVSPAWSPDGKFLAFVSYRFEENPELLMMPASGTDFPARLTQNGANDVSPAWTSDGKYLIFISDRTMERRSKVYRIGEEGEGTDQHLSFDTNITFSIASWSQRQPEHPHRILDVVGQGQQ